MALHGAQWFGRGKVWRATCRVIPQNDVSLGRLQFMESHPLLTRFRAPRRETRRAHPLQRSSDLLSILLGLKRTNPYPIIFSCWPVVQGEIRRFKLGLHLARHPLCLLAVLERPHLYLKKVSSSALIFCASAGLSVAVTRTRPTPCCTNPILSAAALDKSIMQRFLSA